MPTCWASWLLPFFSAPARPFIDDATRRSPTSVMALGLNIVVGFAGLLDLGYVAFFAIGAYTVGWFGSGFYRRQHEGHPHRRRRRSPSTLPGIHINFLFVLVAAAIIAAISASLIGRRRCACAATTSRS